MTVRRDLTIANETQHLSTVRRVVGEVLDLSPFDERTRNMIVVAVDEALANVVEHAYGKSRGDVHLSFGLSDEHLEVIIRDNGQRFDPPAQMADVAAQIKNGARGGYGLFLMRRIMDEVRFAHETPFQNELTMVKRFPPPAGGERAAPGAGPAANKS